MAKYAAAFSRTASTSLSLGTFGAVSTTQARRGKVYDIILGSEATPADAALQWRIQRYTHPGTSTAVTPAPLDAADGAFLGEAGDNHTVEATYTAGAILLKVSLNQRATFRWVAAPGGELVYPATTASGIGIATPIISTGTPALTATVHLEE
jgi:hypothetical protein